MRRLRLKYSIVIIATLFAVPLSRAFQERLEKSAIVNSGILPTHRVPLPPNEKALGATFSVDGQTLFVQTWGRGVINVWEVLIFYWPELLGVLTILTGLLCLLAIRLIVRRKQIVGEPHCRRCGYCLRGLSHSQCPECGVPSTRPIVGRSLARRLLLPLGIFAFVVASYGGLWLLSAPRLIKAPNWLQWWSCAMSDWVQIMKLDAARLTKPASRVLEIDVTSGCVRGALVTRPFCVTLPILLTSTPRGDLLVSFGEGEQGDQIAIVNGRSGRVYRRISPQNLGAAQWGWLPIAGFSDDGECIYLVIVNEMNGMSLVSLNVTSGATNVLLPHLTTYADREAGTSSRRLCRIPLDGALYFLDLPLGDAKGAFVWSAARPEEPCARLEIEASETWDPVFSSDGRQVFLQAYHEPCVQVVDTLTGEVQRPLCPPTGFVLEYRTATSAERGLLIASARISFRRGWMTLLARYTCVGYLAFDVNRMRWGAWYSDVSLRGYLRPPLLSPDGHRFATQIPSSRSESDFLLFELTEPP